jgi:hypothetical protein
VLRRFIAVATSAALVSTLVVGFGPAAGAADIGSPVQNTATVESRGDVLLSWAATPGAAAYTVQVATDQSGAASSLVTSVAGTRNLSWVPPTTIQTTEDRTLYWRVGSHATTSGAPTYSAYQPFDVPALPTPQLVSPGSDLGGTVVYPKAVVFTWQPVPGAQSYTVEYSADGFPTGTAVANTTTATTFTPATPLARTSGGDPITWSWRVRANFYVGSSTAISGAFSDPYSFNVAWPASASRPELQSPADGANLSDVKLQWKSVPGAASYKVVVGVSRSDDLTLVTSEVVAAQGTTTATTFVPAVALLDQNYFWQIVPLDYAGNPGIASEVRQFRKVWGDQTAANAAAGTGVTYPVPLVGGQTIGTATPTTLADFKLAWNPIPRATFYEVEVYPTNGEPMLSCHTASTSASIVAVHVVGTGSNGSLVGADDCLWSSEPTKRIRAGGTYRWRVRGIDYSGASATTLTSSLPTGTLWSDWSDPQDGQFPERARYVAVLAGPPPTGGEIAAPDLGAWTAEQSAAAGRPSPEFRWSPASYVKTVGQVGWVDGYDVRIALNEQMTNVVAQERTPATSLRVNGVFQDNETTLPYFWQVRPFVVPTGSWTDVVYTDDWSAAHPSWTKTSTATAFWPSPSADADHLQPVTTYPDGTVLLSWKPQAVNALEDGGSRGYLLVVKRGDGSSVGSKKIEYPWYVAADPASGKPLAAGSYKFTVQPLDANGNAGRPSADQAFTIAAPAPVVTPVPDSPVGTVRSSVSLTWTPAAPAVRYNVQYWNVANPDLRITVGSTSVKQSAVTVGDLQPGEYRWHVQSVDSAGNVSSWSSASDFTVVRQAPNPTVDAGVLLGTTERRLSWDPVAGASRYLVQVSYGTTTTAHETRATSFAPTVDMVYGTTYTWSVVALGEKYGTGSSRISLGESAARTFTVSTLPLTPSVSNLSIAGTGLIVTWNDLVGAARGTNGTLGYDVRFRPQATPAQDWSYRPTVMGTTLTLSGLVGNTTYEVQVAARNSEGLGAWSSTRTRATAGPPGSPQNLRATAGLRTLAVQWSTPSTVLPVSSYSLRWRALSSTTWTTKTFPASTTAYTITGLSQTTYRVEVRAVSPAGTGLPATIDQVSYAPASAPRSLVVKRGDRQATATWIAPSSLGGSTLAGYVVDRRVYSSSLAKWGVWTQVNTTGATTTTAVLSPLTNGMRYEFRVTARTTAGPGSASAAVAVIPAGKPKAPTYVKVALTAGKSKVTWVRPSSNGSALTSQKIQVSTNGTTFTTVKTTTGTATSYTWTGGRKGKAYFVRVIAYNAVGASPPSTAVRFVAK